MDAEAAAADEAPRPGLEVVVAHAERATLRVGTTFLKIDADPVRCEREAAAMSLAPLPTARILWRQDHVFALAGLPGAPLGRLGVPESAPAAAWEAAGAALRTLHDAPVPPWPGRDREGLAAQLDAECGRLLEDGALPRALVERNREIARAALLPRAPVFVHGDLQTGHVFVDGENRVTGILDWSEAAPGDRHEDLATLTLGHGEHLEDVLRGYGPADVEIEAVHGWWSLRCLTAIRWLGEHGFDPAAPGCEIDVLRAMM